MAAMPRLTNIPTRRRAIATMFIVTMLWGFTYPTASSAYLGVVATAIALTVQTWGQRHVSTNEAVRICCTALACGAIAGAQLNAPRACTGRWSLEIALQLARVTRRDLHHTVPRNTKNEL